MTDDTQIIDALHNSIDHLKARIKELEEELMERDASFDLRWDADKRAIKRWQENSGKTDTWPDHTDLCVFLLEKLGATEETLEEAREAHAMTRRREDKVMAERAELRKKLQDQDRLMLRVRALLSWAPRTDPNRKWIEEHYGC